MLYDLEQGPREERIIKQARQAGQPIPDNILNSPMLSPGLQFFYSSFVELCTTRDSMGPIPWTALHAYAQFHEMDPDEEDYFIIVMRIMDAAYTQWLAEKQKRAHKEASAGVGRKR